MGYVHPNNKKDNTPKIRAKIQKVADMIVQINILQESVVEMCRNDPDLHALNIWYASDVNSDRDVIATHDEWLASNHNC
jgi:hypothetical protein